MAGRYMLDTNIAVHVLNQKLDLLGRSDDATEFYLDVAAAGELLYGAAKSGRPEQNRRRVESFVQSCPVLTHDLATASRYGLLKAELRKRGRMIPENDLWIAASALRHSLVLVTRDRHFDEVEGLLTEAW